MSALDKKKQVLDANSKSWLYNTEDKIPVRGSTSFHILKVNFTVKGLVMVLLVLGRNIPNFKKIWLFTGVSLDPAVGVLTRDFLKTPMSSPTF